MPKTLTDAYRLQSHSIAAWGDSVVGWKVGGVPAAYLNRFDERFLAGPIFANSVRAAEGIGPVAMEVFDGGFAAIEPEFVLRLGAKGENDRMFIGAEIASSPIPAINDHGPMAVISDFGNNNGLLIGPEIAGWRERAHAVEVVATIDGKRVGEKLVGDFPHAALEALAFLRRLADERGFALPPGTYVSTGAITGVHEAAPGAEAHVDFGDLGRLHLTLVGAPVS